MTTTVLSERPEGLQVLLEEGAAFEGELRFQGTARLAGRFKGVVRGEGGALIIESSASAEGSLFVDHLILQGRFQGKARAEKSALMEPPAQFKGEIQTPSLSIQEGVVFEGVSKKTEGKT